MLQSRVARPFISSSVARPFISPYKFKVTGMEAHNRCVKTSAKNATAPSVETAQTSFRQGITYTYYEANSFHLKFQATGVRVLVDPWLVGDLAFFEQDWLYKGKKRTINKTKMVDINALADDTDLIIITQALDDHCHMPTLRALPKHLPIVAQEQAVEKIKDLGFNSVRSIDHGATISVLEGRLTIQATKGALVGPPWSKRQLGLVLRESDPALTGTKPELHHASVYYEPHCDFTSASVKEVGHVDVVISPVKSALLKVGPVQYPLVQGDINLEKLLDLLRPRVLVPLLNDEIDEEGPLGPYVVSRGDVHEVTARLARAGLPTVVEMPAPPGESLAIAL